MPSPPSARSATRSSSRFSAPWFWAWFERRGTPVTNSPRPIERSVDKFYTTSLMHEAGLPTPETAVCETMEDALAAVRSFGDAIIKPLFGSMVLGMVRAARDARHELAPPHRTQRRQVLHDLTDARSRPADARDGRLRNDGGCPRRRPLVRRRDHQAAFRLHGSGHGSSGAGRPSRTRPAPSNAASTSSTRPH